MGKSIDLPSMEDTTLLCEGGLVWYTNVMISVSRVDFNGVGELTVYLNVQVTCTGKRAAFS